MLSTLLAIVVFLTILVVLVAAHEYGHYLFARIFNMDVEEFAIGMGPKLGTWMRKMSKNSDIETVYTVRALPVGGFVRIAGMIPEEDGSEVNVQNGFYSKPAWQRWLVLFAGPVFSVLAGMLTLIPVFWIMGKDELSARPVFGGLVKDGPAYKAGIKVGDMVKSIDGHAIGKWSDLTFYVRDRGGQPLQMVISRAGQDQTLTVVPELEKEPSPIIDANGQPTDVYKRQGKIMAYPSIQHVDLSFAEASKQAIGAPYTMAAGLLKTFTHTNQISENVGGPIAIFQMTRAATSEGLGTVIFFAGELSISLGILNLLPIPPFDGGQMILAFAEILRRNRRLSFRLQNSVQAAGLLIVVLLVISVFTIDIGRLTKPQRDIIHSSDQGDSGQRASKTNTPKP